MDRQGVIVVTNAAWDRFAAENGYQGGPFVGCNYLELCRHIDGVEGAQATAFVQGVEDVMSGRCAKYELTYPCHSPDQKRWFKGIVYKSGDDLIVMHVDITEEYAEFSRLSGFLARTELIHDLRSPLSAIIGFAEISRGYGADRIDRIKDNLEIIHEAGDQMLSLVNNILTVVLGIARSENLNEVRVDLGALLQGICRQLAPVADKSKVAVTVDVQDDFALIGDREGLRKVFANLIGNAIKYNRSGGAVWVEAVYNASNGIDVVVRDNGLGIPDDQVDKIFEPFYRAKGGGLEQREGSGLGLAICRDLIGMHGGAIQVESTFGEGSTFTVRLPSWRTQND